MKSKKKSKTMDSVFFVFNHRKLNYKAKEYRHEVFHLTKDLININIEIQKTLSECMRFISILGQPSKGYQIDYGEGFKTIEDLRYHMENFIFRIHAYRDKISLFVNFALKIGYMEDERKLLTLLINNNIIKNALLSTELIKLNESPFREFMTKRKAMSHKSYYSSGLYNEHFMPHDESLSPKKIGVKKASIEWRRNIKKEPDSINDCLTKIFDLNEKIISKVKAYLDKNK